MQRVGDLVEPGPAISEEGAHLVIELVIERDTAEWLTSECGTRHGPADERSVNAGIAEPPDLPVLDVVK